ncbi:MAG TPA: DNA primase [Sphingobium sp.]|uniref:DNA primase n=1 Tax=Sphingobium sp. TaxID=1912891 RepID=UPI002ED16927
MTLSPQWLDELRARTTLSSLIGKSIKVTKSGKEYAACCPFHNEKTPSFTINDEKGFYHCFGCGAHGDAIRWMTEQRGLPFMDAVKELASAAGMDVPAPSPQQAERNRQAKTLHDVMAAAQAWFVQQLNGLEGTEARAYLQRRGITPETARNFGIGFAPDSRGKLRTALKEFGDAMLIETGMLIQPEEADREPYDRFRGRLMIPIRDARGRVIAFGGRILGEGQPKYLNSPDTPLFDKGRTLYNLDRAAPAARASGRIIVVEGYMDAIALAQAGIEEVMAPLGTALTEAQMVKLWTMVECPVLCFDGDGAGQRAANRAAVRALPGLVPGQSLSFAVLPAGQDPDDLVRASGVAAMEKVLGEADPLIERLWQAEASAGPTDTPERRAGLQARLNGHIATIQDQSIRREYDRMMRDRYWQAFGKKRKGEARQEAARPGMTGSLSVALVDALLSGLEQWPQVARRVAEQLDQLVMPSSAMDDRRRMILRAAYGDGDAPAATGSSLTFIGAQASEAEAATALVNLAGALAAEQEIAADLDRVRQAMSAPDASGELWQRHCALVQAQIANAARLSKVYGIEA